MKNPLLIFAISLITCLQATGQNVVQLRLLEAALTKKFQNTDSIEIASLSKREIQFVRRFPEIDGDRDGVVTKDEALDFKRAILGESSKDNPAVNMNGTAATYANVSYGPHERNTLDLWVAPGDKPTALVVFVHGGGFKYGDKSIYYKNKDFAEVLSKGVSVATINYRFLKHTEKTDGLLGCLRDVGRAVQFIRYKSEEWNLDPQRIGAIGGSAGGGAAVYLGSRDDLADKGNDDPILRESSRLTVVAAMEAQSTYDFRKWQSILGLDDEDMKPLTEQAIESYALPKRTALDSAELISMCREVDMLSWLDENDAPMWLRNIQAGGKPQDAGERVHHPNHVVAIKKRAKEVGLDVRAYAPELGFEPLENEQVPMLEFVLKRLQPKPQAE